MKHDVRIKWHEWGQYHLSQRYLYDNHNKKLSILEVGGGEWRFKGISQGYRKSTKQL